MLCVEGKREEQRSSTFQFVGERHVLVAFTGAARAQIPLFTCQDKSSPKSCARFAPFCLLPRAAVNSCSGCSSEGKARVAGFRGCQGARAGVQGARQTAAVRF